jgi:glycerol-3-phosphate O-acyltransferase
MGGEGGMHKTLRFQLIQTFLGFFFSRVLVEHHEPPGTLPAGRHVIYVVEAPTFFEKLYLYWLLTREGLPLPELGWLHRVAEGAEAPGLLDVSQEDAARNLLSGAIQRGEEYTLAPVNIVWDKRPEPQSTSPLASLLGTFDQPGFWRKAFQFGNIAWQSFFVFGAPIARLSARLRLSEIRAEFPQADQGEVVELAHELLTEALREQRQSIVGPEIKRNQDIAQAILRDPNTVDLVQALAAQEQQPLEAVEERARRLLKELSADFSLTWLKGLGAILSPIFYRIYRGFYIDKKGIQRLMSMSGRRVVLVPSHKSHIDYLVLSYVLYQHGMMPPHIAAGINLAFWPVGTIFRKSGAFFIRRSFAHDRLYAHIFHQYLTWLLKNDILIEFFIEGTRSRTGKVMKPRYGMLKSILQISIENQMDDIVFLPLSVAYEKVIEGSSYQRESLGGEKRSESTAGLLKASSVLVSDYGRVHIEFGEPLEARAYLERYGVSAFELDAEALDRTTTRLAHRIVYEIANATPVTPSSLAALVLMNPRQGGLREREFTRAVGFVVQIMLHPHNRARISSPIQQALNLDPEEEAAATPAPILLGSGPHLHDPCWLLGKLLTDVLRQAIFLLEKNGLLQAREQGGELLYEATPRKRSELNYYKNNIIHFLVDEMILASSLLARLGGDGAPLSEVSATSLFLSQLMKHEFIYQERAKDETRLTRFEASFGAAVEFFEGVGWAQVEGDTLRLRPEARESVVYLHRGLWSFIESYHFGAKQTRELLRDGQWLPQKDLIQKLLRRAQNELAVGNVSHAEAVSKSNFENLLRVLVEFKALEQRHQVDKKGRRVTEHRLPEDQGAWERLLGPLSALDRDFQGAL